MDLIIKAIEKSNYIPGKEVFIALDVAGSDFLEDRYIMSGESLKLKKEEMVNYYSDLIKNYPIISIEDGLDENDWDGWVYLTSN